MFQANHEKERGQSILIIAFAVVVLLVLVALVVDIGNAYAQRRIVQNAVDAAAVAGAQKLAQRDLDRNPPQVVRHIEVLNAINNFAERNGLDRQEVQALFVDENGAVVSPVLNSFDPVPVAAEGVSVNGVLVFPTYLAQLLGIDTITVDAGSDGYVLNGPCSNEELFPIVMSNTTFGGGAPQLYQEYTMWDQGLNAPGNFGWVYWEDGTGVNRCPYANCTQSGSVSNSLRPNILDTTRSGFWEKDDWVHGSTGVNFQSVLPELGMRVNATLPPTVTIPIYSSAAAGQGNNALFQIDSFAAFRLTCAYHSQNHKVESYAGACDACAAGPSNAKCVRGYFVREVVPPFEDGCIDTGISAPSLRRPKPNTP